MERPPGYDRAGRVSLNGLSGSNLTGREFRDGLLGHSRTGREQDIAGQAGTVYLAVTGLAVSSEMVSLAVTWQTVSSGMVSLVKTAQAGKLTDWSQHIGALGLERALEQIHGLHGNRHHGQYS